MAALQVSARSTAFRSIPTSSRMIEDVCARHVVGADPFKIERLWRIVYSSGYTQRPDTSLMGILSGIEMACWDIVGKELGKPVYELLGGRVHERCDPTPTCTRRTATGPTSTRILIWRQRRANTSNRGSPRSSSTRSTPIRHSIRASCRWRRSIAPSALRGDTARCRRQPLRSAVRDPWPDDRGRRDPSGQAPGAVRSALARGADAEMPEEMARVARQTSIPIATGERLATKYEFARARTKQRRSCRWRWGGSAVCSRRRRSPAWPRPTMPRSRRISTAARSRAPPTSRSAHARPIS